MIFWQNYVKQQNDMINFMTVMLSLCCSPDGARKLAG